MNRRGFLASSLIGIAALRDTGFGRDEDRDQAVPAQLPQRDTFQLTSKFSDDSVKAIFTGASTPASVAPHMYLFFDRKVKKFVKPDDVAPELAPAKYELSAELISFGISNAARGNFSIDQKKDLQLTLNVTAPQSADENDNLSWVFMNAIDIFLGKPSNIKPNLTKFLDNNKLTAPLKPTSKIVIPQGAVELQVVALGQKKQGFWRIFFSLVTKLSNASIFASVGLPALVPEALSFVNTCLNQLEHGNEPLTEIWRTKRIPFGIFKGSDADFKLKSGYWVIVDRSYALSTNMLQDHKLDFDGQTFDLVTNGNQQIDANYLTARFAFAQPKS